MTWYLDWSPTGNKMIREYTQPDADVTVSIWLNASIEAHNFIPQSYWENKVDDMKNIYLPNSNTFVYEQENQIIGFISLIDDYLAAIFVSPQYQNIGIGKELMNHVKSKKEELLLKVYIKNKSSVEFYKRQGFRIIGEQQDEDTVEMEYKMKWSKKA